MKHKALTISFLFIGILLLTTSCDRIYCTNPQPIDSENIYEFPEKIRGIYSEKNDSVIFGKAYFKNIEYKERKVAKHEADTSSLYILKNNKIYLVDYDEEVTLSEGFPYELREDSIIYLEREVFEIALGQNAFLRKVSNNYILNVKNMNQWWEIYLLEFTQNDNINARYLDPDYLDKTANIKILHKLEHEYYLEVKWTSADINEIIKTGGFSDTLISLNLNQGQSLKN